MTGPGVRVILNGEEMTHVHNLAGLIHVAAVGRGAAERYGQDNDPLEVHARGVAGEMAFAKYLDVFWLPGFRRQRAGEHDVGDWEVRANSRLTGDLFLHPGDDPDAPYVLVVGVAPILYIVGWIRGRDGKRDKWWRALERPAFCVPQSALIPFPEAVAV